MHDRIGDILVGEGLVGEGDVRDALELARRRRMRLASALVTLGRISADDASRALARQHGVPAALDKHLAGRDLALAELLPAQIAWTLGALPLAVARDRDALVVCTRDPTPSAIPTLERATGRPVMLAVAVDCALLPLIAATYPVAYDSVSDEIEIDLDTGPMIALAEGDDAIDPALLQLVELDHHGVAKDHSQVGARLPPFGAPSSPPARTLAVDPALLAIAAAERGDQVIDALLAYLRYRFAAGMVFVCKDGHALGQAGFGHDVAADAVVPLDQPSVLRLAHDEAGAYVGAPLPDDGFARRFGAPPPKVVVVPVSIDGRVTNLLYGHAPRLATIEEAAIELGSLAEAAEDAFLRIIGPTSSD